MPLIDSLANLIGDAITDLRQRVVEEPWFGRAVTEGQGFDDMVRATYGESAASPADRDQFQEIDLDR